MDSQFGVVITHKAQTETKHLKAADREIWTPSAACEFNRIPAGTYARLSSHTSASR
jgi:hypothetical protein